MGLLQNGKPLVSDLFQDLRDGEVLLSLLEILTAQQYVSAGDRRTGGGTRGCSVRCTRRASICEAGVMVSGSLRLYNIKLMNL